jgi:hypothetical protein
LSTTFFTSFASFLSHTKTRLGYLGYVRPIEFTQHSTHLTYIAATHIVVCGQGAFLLSLIFGFDWRVFPLVTNLRRFFC